MRKIYSNLWILVFSSLVFFGLGFDISYHISLIFHSEWYIRSIYWSRERRNHSPCEKLSLKNSKNLMHIQRFPICSTLQVRAGDCSCSIPCGNHFCDFVVGVWWGRLVCLLHFDVAVIVVDFSVSVAKVDHTGNYCYKVTTVLPGVQGHYCYRVTILLQKLSENYTKHHIFFKNAIPHDW